MARGKPSHGVPHLEALWGAFGDMFVGLVSKLTCEQLGVFVIEKQYLSLIGHIYIRNQKSAPGIFRNISSSSISVHIFWVNI